jgi:hypothetical protein
VLAACSAPATSQGPGSGTGPPGSTPGPITGGILDACALLTGDEAGGAIHTQALTPTGTTGDPAHCSYALPDGEEALVIDVMRNGAQTQYQGFVDAGTAEDVSGVGDRALYERGTRRLVFMVGDVLVYVFPRYVNGADAALEADTAIGKVIAARLTTGAVPTGLAATPPPLVSAETACDLLSADEASGVMGQQLKSEGNPAVAQFCTYSVVSSGEVVLTTYLQRVGGSDTWPGLEGSLTTEPVSGLGEKAMFEPSTSILFVLQGDAILNVNVFGRSPADALALDRQLAEIALTHL